MQFPEEIQRSIEIRRFVGLSLAILSVGVLVIGVLLLVTCQTTTDTTTGTVGCAYPFQTAGVVFLYLAFLLALGAGNVFAGSPALGPADAKAGTNRWEASILVAVIVGLIMLALLTAIHLS